MNTKHTPPLPARWYAVSRRGMATLCVDQADAEATAIDAASNHPREAPYQAVQLVDAAQRDAVIAELLEALRGLVKSFPTDSDMYAAGWEGPEVTFACEAYDKARAAIAKATGEQQ